MEKACQQQSSSPSYVNQQGAAGSISEGMTNSPNSLPAPWEWLRPFMAVGSCFEGRVCLYSLSLRWGSTAPGRVKGKSEGGKRERGGAGLNLGSAMRESVAPVTHLAARTSCKGAAVRPLAGLHDTLTLPQSLSFQFPLVTNTLKFKS